MATFEGLKILGFDHLEFAVADLEKSIDLYLRMGFENLGTREVRERQLKSVLMGQNDLFVLLSHSVEPNDPVAQYVQKHGDGVITVAIRCEDAANAVDIAARRGATVLQPPRSIEKDFGNVAQATIAAFGDVRHTFVSREGLLFADGFDAPFADDVRGNGLIRIDAVTITVEAGKCEHWRQYYENIFGLTESQSSAVSNPSLRSTAMTGAEGRLPITLVEPTDDKGLPQDFLNMHHGAGVQHVALQSGDLATTLEHLRAHSVELRPAAGSSVFTNNLVGGFFYEIAQRPQVASQAAPQPAP